MAVTANEDMMLNLFREQPEQEFTVRSNEAMKVYQSLRTGAMFPMRGLGSMLRRLHEKGYLTKKVKKLDGIKIAFYKYNKDGDDNVNF